MAEAPFRAQTVFAVGHGMQQFIAVQAAFHQQLATALADQGDTTLGGGVAVWHVLHGQPVDIQTGFAGGCRNLLARANQNRCDQPGLGGLQRPA